MSQRFSARYSPGDDAQHATTAQNDRPRPSHWREARVDPVGARSNVLFVPPFVLAFGALNDGALTLAVSLAGAGALLLGAWLLREGLRAQAAFEARKHARRPAVPRKILAAGACGVGTALAAFSHDPGLLAPLLYGAMAGGLHLTAFGLDPLSDKAPEGTDSFQQDRVARVVDEAEAYLDAMLGAVRQTGERRVEARVERFQNKVRDLIRTVEEDPRDLTAARKYLGVYLMGARDAATKYANIVSRRPDPGATSDFLALLGDLEAGFDQKTEALLADNGTELTIEIDVLRARLRRDGVAPQK